jgi:hypothetical protein
MHHYLGVGEQAASPYWPKNSLCSLGCGNAFGMVQHAGKERSKLGGQPHRNRETVAKNSRT